MVDGARWSRSEARRRLRSRLSDLGEPLRLLAEEIRGEEERTIDWVAARPDGRVVVALLTTGSADAALLADGLVQRAWVGARLRDWEKLAPGLDVRPEQKPVVLLIASEFPRWLRLAAREADPEGVWLARYRPGDPALERLPLPQAPAVPEPPPRARSRFRTGLDEDDLSLSSGEPLRLA